MFPLRSFIYNFTLDSSSHVLSPSKVGKKTVYWHPKHWILSFPLTSCMHIVSYWRLMLFVANLCETALLLKTVKPMLYLGNVLLLHYVLIYNLEVSVEGGCLGYPGASTVDCQSLDRILPLWLVNPRNPAMSPHSKHPSQWWNSGRNKNKGWEGGRC